MNHAPERYKFYKVSFARRISTAFSSNPCANSTVYNLNSLRVWLLSKSQAEIFLCALRECHAIKSSALCSTRRSGDVYIIFSIFERFTIIIFNSIANKPHKSINQSVSQSINQSHRKYLPPAAEEDLINPEYQVADIMCLVLSGLRHRLVI